jgi:mannosyl-oligosaccharide alpha-1,3-glucosidase
VTSSSTSITVRAKTNKAVIRLSPFQIEFYHNEVLTVKANSNGLMKFEQLLTRPATLEPSEIEHWEESFNGVVDLKPNGPEAIAMDFNFPESDVLFGIPEHADSFALRVTTGTEPYRLFPLDNPAYELDSPESLYGAVPVLYGHGARKTAGVFWLNSADTYIDIHDMKNAHFISEVGVIDVYVLLGPTPHETFQQFTKLVGVGNLPQLFTLAYHQCRWNYISQQDVLEVVANFDKFEIPLDTMWLDIEYTDQKKYFTWDHAGEFSVFPIFPHFPKIILNYTAFPQPLEMIRNLTASGRHLTHIIDPHYKKDENYFFYKASREGGYFVKNIAGEDYEGVSKITIKTCIIEAFSV